MRQPDVPGWGFIEQVEDLLFGGASPRDIKDVAIGELDNFSNPLPSLSAGLTEQFKDALAFALDLHRASE